MLFFFNIDLREKLYRDKYFGIERVLVEVLYEFNSHYIPYNILPHVSILITKIYIFEQSSRKSGGVS